MSGASPVVIRTRKRTRTPRRVGTHDGRRGFALLITITLLALLVLLLVSLAALTRVETAVAANTRDAARAREHALMALNLALGQLQAHAGPDARLTAQAAITSTGALTNPHFTGVWDGTLGSAALTWLVSGSESAPAAAVLASAPDPADDLTTNDEVFLVGDRSVATDPAAPLADEKARRIKLAKQDIRAPPGVTPGLHAMAAPRVGRYAWWVGDQGVKASLALTDRANEVTYAPWDTPAQRRRLRQQIASTPNYFRASHAVTSYAKDGFDPVTAGPVLANVRAQAQFEMLAPAAGTLTGFGRRHFHDFTPVSRAVLANTRTDAHAGLMRDLSLAPEEMGAAFAGYANHDGRYGAASAYMERPGQTLVGASDAYPTIGDVDSPRRRYAITPAVFSTASDPVPGLVFGVSPVVAEVVLQFRVSSSGGYQVGTKIYAGLWNPYTSALAVQDDLELRIHGLPQITVTNAAGTSSAQVDLQADLPAMLKEPSSGAMRVRLPFTPGAQADRRSWLPGRVYGWVTKNAGDGAIDEVLKFYNKNLGSAGRIDYAGGPLAGGSSGLGVSAPTVESLTIELRNTSGLLATYTAPAFSAFTIPATAGTKWFAYAFRLKQPWAGDSDRTWLKTFTPHDRMLSATAWSGFDPTVDFAPPLNPAAYTRSDVETALPGALLYRIQGTTPAALSCYNDTPLFELPRAPLLSLGQLQHLAVTGERAFALGNSWGGAGNAVFDRFFFSGLPLAGSVHVPDLAQGQPLPNWNLHVVNTADIGAVQSAGRLSSRHLLQAGGFNVNSTSAAAWRAVLSGLRCVEAFESAQIETASNPALGTQKTSTAVVSETFAADPSFGAGAAAPTFFRFPQSAQETYFWKPVTSSSSDSRQLSTHPFRLGIRGSNTQGGAASAVDASVTAHHMTTDQLEALAEEIVRRVKSHAAAAGPFRTLEQFLGPAAGAGTPSVLETAIEAAGLNCDEVQPLDHAALVGASYGAGLSSLTLTQADLLTALAPYLRVRSDTFTIRSYGEALNPITEEVAGRAWLEAIVQRFPEVVDPLDDIEKPSGAFGRRFKIISFRWLSPSDI